MLMNYLMKFLSLMKTVYLTTGFDQITVRHVYFSNFTCVNFFSNFYRAMLGRARLCHSMSCPSVWPTDRLSVWLWRSGTVITSWNYFGILRK